MDFENLPLARDLLYLTAGFAGILLACILSFLRRDISIRRRNRIVTLFLCVASAAVLSFAGMLICSQGRLLFAGPLLLPAGVGLVVLALAFRFPRAGAFPLFLASGLFIVWLGYTFLRFPRIVPEGTPLALVQRGSDQTISIRFTYYTRYGDETELLTLEDDGQVPEFSATLIHFDERYPLIGGEDRGGITRIRRLRENYYAYPFPGSEKYPPGISLQSCNAGPGPFPAGRKFLVFFDGKTLDLRPDGPLSEAAF